MSVIKKPDLKIFAQDAKTGEIETFPDVLRGWGITLDKTAGKPPLEWFNAIGKRVDEWLMYLTQRGVAEWDAALSYPKTAIVQWNGVIYVSNKETKGEQPDKSQTAWSTLGVFLGLGNYYTKTDTDTKFQPKGDYATNTALKNGLDGKFDKKGGALDGNITAEGGFVSSRNGKNTIALKTVNTTEPIITVSKDDSKTWQNHMFPDKSGTLMHVGDYGIGVPIALTASDNLGKIIKPGNYIQKYTGQATIANEYPIERAGTLMVTLTADGNVLQEYRAHNSSALIYYRSISDTGTSANVPWISQYNTGNTTKDANGFLRTGSKTALITDNIVQATGTSTTNVMSQDIATKAIADAKKAGTDAQSTADSAASAVSAAQNTANAANAAATNANNNANSRVPNTRKVNGKALSTDITITAGDVGSYTKAEVDNKIGAVGGKNTASKTDNGWWKCGDTGMMLQNMHTTFNDWSDNVVNFPVPFPNKCINVVVSVNSSTNNPGNYAVYVRSWNAKSVTVYISGISPGPLHIMAMGY
ncbi:hypothetical protein ACJLWH_000564 [Providencia stuartii]